MKAEITRTPNGVAVPNFGINTKDPLTFFIDIDILGSLERFVCPVDEHEYIVYLTDVLQLHSEDYRCAVLNLNMELGDEHMSAFLNHKNNEWYLVDEDNNRIPEADLIWDATISGFIKPE